MEIENEVETLRKQNHDLVLQLRALQGQMEIQHQEKHRAEIEIDRCYRGAQTTGEFNWGNG